MLQGKMQSCSGLVKMDKNKFFRVSDTIMIYEVSDFIKYSYLYAPLNRNSEFWDFQLRINYFIPANNNWQKIGDSYYSTYRLP